MKLRMLVYHHDLECHATFSGSYLQGQGHSVGPNLQKISFEPFATKLGIVVHQHEPECCVTILDCCAQGQGHSEGSNPQGIYNLS